MPARPRSGGGPGGRAVERVDFRGRSSCETGAELLKLFKRHGIQAVLLAGFLRLLPANVCKAYRRRALNIHPALLPAFGGKGMYGARVHEAVLRSGSPESGPTVHYVNEQYDKGAILAQWPVRVHPGDTPASLAARVLEVEHILYPAAAAALARSIATGSGPPAFRRPQVADGDLRNAIESSFAGA